MLNVSIVLYYPDWEQVIPLCMEIGKAEQVRYIYLVDNSPTSTETNLIQSDAPDKRKEGLEKVKYIWCEGKNLGYGKANNIAIRESVWLKTRYHLVMNPDIRVTADALDRLHHFMDKNPTVGIVMPKVVYPDGELQYLCKLLPTPLNMIGRRFLPKRWTRKHNDKYEMRWSGYDKIMNVPYLSGCFMFLRTEAVLQARLFDERYFMYPEDIDLTRTIHRNWLTLYVPDITIIHQHEKASYKSLRMTWVHIKNMYRYFNKWGWFRDPERDMINQLTLSQFDSSTES